MVSQRSRMSLASEKALTSVFDKYADRRRASLASPTRASASPHRSSLHEGAAKRISKEELRADAVFGEMDEGVFDLLFRLFDPKDTGAVDTDQFVMAVGLIASASQEGNLELSIEACFYMFDTGRTGTLTRTDFETMVNTTIALKLEFLLQTDEGTKAFSDQLQKEFSHENFTFWQEARAYAQAADGERAPTIERGLDGRTDG